MMLRQVLLLSLLSSLTFSQCCSKFNEVTKKCSECSSGSHLYREHCLQDIENCEIYENGFDCSKCKANFNLLAGACISNGNIAPYVDTQQDINTNDNLIILADYSKSVQSNLVSAQVLWGFVRKYSNNTEHTIVDFEAAGPKYYRSIAVF